MATTSYRKHTVAKVFDYICNNEMPWVALGNFLNYWWAYAVDHRRELIEAPLAPAPTPEMQRWAAFCAAMVEWLCWEAGLPPLDAPPIPLAWHAESPGRGLPPAAC